MLKLYLKLSLYSLLITLGFINRIIGLKKLKPMEQTSVVLSK